MSSGFDNGTECNRCWQLQTRKGTNSVFSLSLCFSSLLLPSSSLHPLSFVLLPNLSHKKRRPLYVSGLTLHLSLSLGLKIPLSSSLSFSLSHLSFSRIIYAQEETLVSAFVPLVSSLSLSVSLPCSLSHFSSSLILLTTSHTPFMVRAFLSFHLPVFCPVLFSFVLSISFVLPSNLSLNKPRSLHVSALVSK